MQSFATKRCLCNFHCLSCRYIIITSTMNVWRGQVCAFNNFNFILLCPTCARAYSQNSFLYKLIMYVIKLVLLQPEGLTYDLESSYSLVCVLFIGLSWVVYSLPLPYKNTSSKLINQTQPAINQRILCNIVVLHANLA